MTAFFIGAALLLLTTLAFLLPPLLRKESDAGIDVQRDQVNLTVLRDQLRELEKDLATGLIEREAYDSARRDLEQRVVEEVQPAATGPASVRKRPWSALAVGLLVPGLAIAMYLSVGEPNALDPTQQIAQNEGAHDVTPEQVEGMVQALAQRLQNDPDNIEGWVMLARSYNALGRYPQASDAYARVIQLVPNDAGLLADYADTYAMANGRSLQGEAERLVDRALQLDPRNVKALALAGSAAFERGAYADAAARWQRILALVPPESDIARSTSDSIAEAQGKLSQSGVAQPSALRSLRPVAPAATATATAKNSVQGVVDLDPALRAQVSENDTVFVFARAAEGPRIPLAVLRKQVRDLPLTFTLDDSMSMTPETKLSGAAMVVVGARISKSGSATPAAGDLEGMTKPVAPGATGLKVRIDKRNG